MGNDEQAIRKLFSDWHDATVAGYSGFTLTILRKKRDGSWVLFRDANMLTAETSPSK
jgi:hypothetical protein